MKRLAFLALVACGPSDPPGLTPSLTIVTEPTLRGEATATLENRWRRTDLIVSTIRLEPDFAPARWHGAGPWTLAPGETRNITVRFDPTEAGEWQETLRVQTNAGPLRTTVDLVAAVGFDEDNDQWSIAMGDCDDTNPLVHPEKAEECDGLDNDCDGMADEDFDEDEDGHLSADHCEAMAGDDCDDSDPSAFPGQEEECDQTDSDCNGIIDDIDDLADLQAGVCAGALKECTFGGPREPDYTLMSDYEPAERSCDGLDNDCDGGIDDFDYLSDGTSDCTDDDGDGESEFDGDCDDQNSDLTRLTCGARFIGITSLADGYSLIDLNIHTLDAYSTGSSVYHGMAVTHDDLWFADRGGQRIVQSDPTSGTTAIGEDLGAEAMAVLNSSDSTTRHVLLGDGTLYSGPPEAYASSIISLSGLPTAMTLDPEDDTLWVCTSDGYLHHVDPSSAEVQTVTTDTECFGPPVVDPVRERVWVFGYLNYSLVAVDRSALTIEADIHTEYRVLRGVLADETLWISRGVDHAIETRDPDTLDVLTVLDVSTQAQGLWWDPIRNRIWLALYDADEILGFQADTGANITRHTMVDPVYIFPVPP